MSYELNVVAESQNLHISARPERIMCCKITHNYFKMAKGLKG